MTCCPTASGSFGCCPYANASCCSDKVISLSKRKEKKRNFEIKIHCCANGYSCDDSGNRCIRHFQTFNQNNFKLMKKLIVNDDQLCADGVTRCLSNTTCCPNKQNNSVTYSCCPYTKVKFFSFRFSCFKLSKKKGVCCGGNGSVCCPNGYDCNEQQLSCQLRDENSIILRNLLTISHENQCPSSNIVCSNEQTCCSTNGHTSACCPYQNVNQ